MPKSSHPSAPVVPQPRTNASEIAPGVYVGGWADAERFEGLRIFVSEEAPDGPIPAEAHLPIYDVTADAADRVNLDRAAALGAEAVTRGEPVLYFCGHGIRRGALAGAWYLRRRDGLSLDAAIARVRSVRPKIEHPRQWIGHWRPLEPP